MPTLLPTMTDDRDARQLAGESGCRRCSADAQARADVLRCDCGNLLARYVGEHIELKCRRCKRIVMVPIERAAEDVR